MKKEDKMISAEELRIRLKISKRKAAWLLQNQIIPCQISDKGTHKYLIRERDVEKYLARPPAERAGEIPVGLFNSRNPRTDQPEALKCTSSANHLIPMSDEEKERFIRFLQRKFASLPDAITSQQAAEAIGYQTETINRYIQQGQLYAVMYNAHHIIPKIKFIELIASDSMAQIVKKSPTHRDLILHFRKRNSQH